MATRTPTERQSPVNTSDEDYLTWIKRIADLLLEPGVADCLFSAERMSDPTVRHLILIYAIRLHQLPPRERARHAFGLPVSEASGEPRDGGRVDAQQLRRMSNRPRGHLKVVAPPADAG